MNSFLPVAFATGPYSRRGLSLIMKLETGNKGDIERRPQQILVSTPGSRPNAGQQEQVFGFDQKIRSERTNKDNDA